VGLGLLDARRWLRDGKGRSPQALVVKHVVEGMGVKLLGELLKVLSC
jgi:hypothetical protein